MLAFLCWCAIVAILYLAREIVVPITLAILLSFLLAPAVRGLRRVGLGRLPAVGLTTLVAFAAILGFAAIVVHEMSTLAQDVPRYQHNLEDKVRSLPGLLPGGGIYHRVSAVLDRLSGELKHPSPQSPASAEGRPPTQSPTAAKSPMPVEIVQPELGPWQLIPGLIGPLLTPLAAIGLAVVFVVMILLQQEDLRDRLLRLGGRRDLHRTTAAMNDAAQRVSRYLARQLVVNVTCALPIGVGLAFIGIPNAATWGIFVAVLRFIPYLGIVLAASFPVALAIAVAPGWTMLALTLALFVVVELTVSNFVEPWIYGAGTGLSPVALIAAATFWTWLWGPIGLLLSTPLTVCLVVLGRHVPRLEFLDVMLGNRPVLTPQETFYQRLLANDPTEAAEQAEEFAKERSLAEFFDEVAVPALARAQADSDNGLVSAERRAMIRRGVQAMLEELPDEPLESAPASPAPEVCCLAGRNELDEAGALLLAHLLGLEQQIAAKAFPAEALSTDADGSGVFAGATLICLSLLSTSAPARARFIVRRLRRRAPRAKILVAFWAMPDAEQTVEEAAAAASADFAAYSLRDAVAQITRMSRGIGADRPVPEVPISAANGAT
jgi:predicted PurR-regulated permease PerM